MKKLIAILMAALLLVTLMAACGKKDNTTGAAENDAVTEDTTPATEETTAPTEATEDVQAGDDNTGNSFPDVEVEIDTSEDTGDNEGGVIDFDDLLDAAE